MINKSDLIAIRSGIESDFSFIYSTWLKGLYYGDTAFSEMDKNTFMKTYHEVVKVVLTLLGADIRVACLKEDPETILGYSILTKDSTRLHWVFVKKSWRGIGIAKSLTPETVTAVTHLTKSGLGIIRKHKQLKFNPFLLGEEIDERRQEIKNRR